MDQLRIMDIKKMTVAELKELIETRKWSTTGLRLKDEFQKLIVTSSYVDAQLIGIQKMNELISS